MKLHLFSSYSYNIVYCDYKSAGAYIYMDCHIYILFSLFFLFVFFIFFLFHVLLIYIPFYTELRILMR